VSQSRCGWPSSQTSYASSAWWAVTRTNYLIRYRPLPNRIAPFRTPSCDGVRKSGITRPFGRLSLSPGYVSDTLLTRSPLGIATPCDLHVLATPPAFRLSQDQTLQLSLRRLGSQDAEEFFIKGPIHPPARRYTGTDGFRIGRFLEASLSTSTESRLARPTGCHS